MKGLHKHITTVLGIAALLIVGMGAMLAASHSGQQSSRRVSASATTATTAISTRSSTSTPHPTATPPQGSGGQGWIAPTRGPNDGKLVSATLTIDRTSFNGVCTDTGPLFVLTLTVNVTPHITSVAEVDFQWQGNASVGAGLPTPSILLAGEETTKTVTFPISSFGNQTNGEDSWLAIQIFNPDSLTTNQVHFSVNCTLSLADVSGSVTPDTWGGTCSDHQDLLYDFTVYLTPMPPSFNDTQSVSWTMTTDVPNTQETGVGVWHPYLTSGTVPVMFSGDGVKTVGRALVSFYLHLTNQDANGSYWVIVTVNGPNNSTMTKTVMVTKNCN